ncbi:MAG: MBL fold metallo-hydrolase [Acetivibrionales bacterium]|jgi:phosphoribosyl 1,2-cyclic phosphodiesterase
MIKFCSLFSGSSGNAIFLSAGKTKLLIDAGLSGKKIIQALHSIGEDPSELSALLVSHEHIDHVRGAGIISRKFNIPIYANESTWLAMERGLGSINSKNRMYFNTGMEFETGDICVCPFLIPHDAAEPVGFNFYADDRKITVATDIGHMTNQLLQHFEKSDLLLLESNHDEEMLKAGRYPWVLKRRILSDTGHLSNENAGKVVAYMAEKGTRNFLLGHLSKENNFPELAYETVCNYLRKKRIEAGRDIMLDVVHRDRAGRVIEL